ncbi:hypothetical protein [Mycetocola sp. JXN-3]|uniref:hypothetical protein n=1 Tax=Mycetocola sp. JXN-3 TaxID=2116510 RepID=UPI00165D1DA1|nr:hypothetical protein [Mycetocola sp. JXN-3]
MPTSRRRTSLLVALMFAIFLAFSFAAPKQAFNLIWFFSCFLGMGFSGLFQRSVHTPRSAPGSFISTEDPDRYMIYLHGTRAVREPLTGFIERASTLDGNKRSRVSALSGDARLDICGDANGAMVVYFSADDADENAWNLLITPDGGDDEEAVRVDALTVYLSRRETTTLEPALRAASYFLRTETKDPSLNWFASPENFNKRIVRP